MSLPKVREFVIFDRISPVKTAAGEAFSDTEEVFVFDFHIKNLDDVYFRMVSALPKDEYEELEFKLKSVPEDDIEIETTEEDSGNYFTIFCNNGHPVFKTGAFKFFSASKGE